VVNPRVLRLARDGKEKAEFGVAPAVAVCYRSAIGLFKRAVPRCFDFKIAALPEVIRNRPYCTKKQIKQKDYDTDQLHAR
jgi:hypothetical protein